MVTERSVVAWGGWQEVGRKVTKGEEIKFLGWLSCSW